MLGIMSAMKYYSINKYMPKGCVKRNILQDLKAFPMASNMASSGLRESVVSTKIIRQMAPLDV